MTKEQLIEALKALIDEDSERQEELADCLLLDYIDDEEVSRLYFSYYRPKE